MTDSGLPYLRGIVAHTPLQPTDFVDAHDHGDWYERRAEAEAAYVDEIRRYELESDGEEPNQQNPEPTEAYAQELHRPASSVTFDIADNRALLMLDQVHTILACLQDDEDTAGTLTIAAVPYAEGGTEYVITVRP